MKQNAAWLYIIISIAAGYLWTYILSPLISFETANADNIFYIIFAAGIPAAVYFACGGFEEYKSKCLAPPKICGCLLSAAGGAVMWSVGTAVNGAAAEILEYFGVMPVNQLEQTVSAADAAAGLISVCVAAPVFEEIFYRGVLFAEYGSYGVFGSVFVSSLYFALAHGSITVFFMPLIYGVISAAVVKKTGCIYYCVIMHAVSNLISWLCRELLPLGNTAVIVTAAAAFMGICIAVYRGFGYVSAHKNELRADAAGFIKNIPEAAVLTGTAAVYALGNYLLHFANRG